MKYIVFSREGRDMIFVFSRNIDHDRMAEACRAVRFGSTQNWNRDFFRAKPIAAGFVTDGRCHGRSESLDVDSRGEADTKLLGELA